MFHLFHVHFQNATFLKTDGHIYIYIYIYIYVFID